MDRVFLDANILFSAAYRSESGLKQLWHISEAQLLTSQYAVEEARRAFRKFRRLDRIVEVAAEVEDLALGAVAAHQPLRQPAA